MLLYLIPSFRQGIGEAKGFEPALAKPDMPATDRIFVSNEGGRTISRKALFSVVKGWPLSSISSSNYHRYLSNILEQSDLMHLIDNVKMVTKRCARDLPEVVLQDVLE